MKLLLLAGLILFTGCKLFQPRPQPPTFRSTAIMVDNAMKKYALLVSQKKVTPHVQKVVDDKLTEYLKAFYLALVAAKDNPDAFTPGDAQYLAEELETLIAGL